MPATCRRVYDEASPSDGVRVLVDGLWPRGLRREDLPLDGWMREIAPSAALRRWYGHDPGRFAEFTRRYAREMSESSRADAFGRLRAMGAEGHLTLLTATRDVEHSHAAVLAGWLRAGTVPG